MRATLHLERLSLRLHAPLVTAKGRYPSRDGFRVWLETADGAVGQGEAMPLESFGTGSLAQTERALDAVAQAGFTLPSLPTQLLAELDGQEAFAALPAARHALELAALDLQARREGVTLAAWLSLHAQSLCPEFEVGALLASGGPAGSIPVNALLSSQDPQALATEGVRAVEAGARTLKVKVASGPIALDVQRLRALREAVGPQVRLRLDANGGWTRPDASCALAALRDACAPELCEQPVEAEDVEGLGALRREGHCLIGADEALVTPQRASHLIEQGAADAVILKPMVLGGLLPSLRLGLLAKSRGLHAIVTSSLDGVVARAGAAQLAAVIGEDSWAHGLWVGPLFVDEPVHPYVPVDGRIVLPRGPGLGLAQQAAGPSQSAT